MKAESNLVDIQKSTSSEIMRLEKQKTENHEKELEKRKTAEAKVAKKGIANILASQKLFQKELISNVKLKIKADIEKFSVPIEKFGDVLRDMSSPAGLPRLIGEKIGEKIANFTDALPAVGGAVGGAIGGVLSTLADIGSKSPQEIEQEFRNFSRAIIQDFADIHDSIGRCIGASDSFVHHGIGYSVASNRKRYDRLFFQPRSVWKRRRFFYS